MSDSVRPHRRQPTTLPHPWNSPGKNAGVGCHCLLQCRKVKSESKVTQSCPTLSDPIDCSPSGSSVHGIFQARVLEWGAIIYMLVTPKWIYPDQTSPNSRTVSPTNYSKSLHRYNKSNQNKTQRSPSLRPHIENLLPWQPFPSPWMAAFLFQLLRRNPWSNP